MTPTPNLKLLFYADTPDGKRNKRFIYKIKSFNHAVDLAARFVQEKGFRIRAAYFQISNGQSARFDTLYDLQTRQNSLIQEYDQARQLDQVKEQSDLEISLILNNEVNINEKLEG